MMLAAPLLFSLVCTAQNQEPSAGPDRARGLSTHPHRRSKIFQPQFATCHGADGRRHGPASATLKRKPPNLTRKRTRLASPERSGNAHLRSNLSRGRVRSREGRRKAQSHPATGIHSGRSKTTQTTRPYPRPMRSPIRETKPGMWLFKRCSMLGPNSFHKFIPASLPTVEPKSLAASLKCRLQYGVEALSLATPISVRSR